MSASSSSSTTAAALATASSRSTYTSDYGHIIDSSSHQLFFHRNFMAFYGYFKVPVLRRCLQKASTRWLPQLLWVLHLLWRRAYHHHPLEQQHRRLRSNDYSSISGYYSSMISYHDACSHFSSTANNPLFSFRTITARPREESIAIYLSTRSQLSDTAANVFNMWRTAFSPQSGPARYFASLSTMLETCLRIIPVGSGLRFSLLGVPRHVWLICVQGYLGNKTYTSLGISPYFLSTQ